MSQATDRITADYRDAKAELEQAQAELATLRREAREAPRTHRSRTIAVLGAGAINLREPSRPDIDLGKLHDAMDKVQKAEAKVEKAAREAHDKLLTLFAEDEAVLRERIANGYRLLNQLIEERRELLVEFRRACPCSSRDHPLGPRGLPTLTTEQRRFAAKVEDGEAGSSS